MAIVYFDTSALLKLIVGEHGSPLAAALYNRADMVVTSRIADIEVRSALAAGLRGAIMDAAEYRDALDRWEQLAPTFATVELTGAVAHRAAELVGDSALRAGDAVHVASAVVMQPGAVVAAWDERVSEAARGHGLTVVP
jgi:predicted nucleic acid-binding protein